MRPVLPTNRESGAYRHGVIDAQNGRPRKVDIADTSRTSALYTEGYDSVRPALPVRSTEVTVTLPVDVLLAARRVLWDAGEHQAAVRVLEAYARARTGADQPEREYVEIPLRRRRSA